MLTYTHLLWLWLPAPVHCGSWRVSAARDLVGGALEAAETLEMVDAQPAHTHTHTQTHLEMLPKTSYKTLWGFLTYKPFVCCGPLTLVQASLLMTRCWSSRRSSSSSSFPAASALPDPWKPAKEAPLAFGWKGSTTMGSVPLISQRQNGQPWPSDSWYAHTGSKILHLREQNKAFIRYSKTFCKWALKGHTGDFETINVKQLERPRQ